MNLVVVPDLMRLLGIDWLATQLVSNDLSAFETNNSSCVIESLSDVVTCLVDLSSLYHATVLGDG